MPDSSDVVEVTEPVELAVVDDRLHVTFVSGQRSRTYSLSFHKARNSIHAAMRLLDKASERSRVLPFNKG
jgi:hypothetical protein